MLQRAHDDPSVNNWWWYLATLNYATAPRRRPDGTGESGTKTPIDPSFSSPWVGKGLEDIAQWLNGKPETVVVDDRYFGVLDKEAEKSGKIAICRLNDDAEKAEEVASCILRKADVSTLFLAGLDSGLDWEELVRFQKYTLQL